MTRCCRPDQRPPATLCWLILANTLGLSGAQAASDPGAGELLEEIQVTVSRVANDQPAAGFPSPVTRLRFDPAVDLQSRGMPEGQSDITVRGGIFENTGMLLAGLPLLDPQTGHYFAEIPVAPDMLLSPVVLTGPDNTHRGFNSSVASIDQGLRPIRQGGSVALGFGEDDLNFQALTLGGPLGRTHWSGQLTANRSAADGPRAHSDHRFERLAARLRRDTDTATTDLLFGVQDKFAGWPGLYTGFATLPETDHTRTGLLLLSHRREQDQGWWRIGAYHRRLTDDYDFDRRTRESGVPGAFEHKTRVSGLAFDGQRERGQWRIDYNTQALCDELARSTDLTAGAFDSRCYFSLSALPGRSWTPAAGHRLILQAGLRLDDSSRDNAAWSPSAQLSYRINTVDGYRQLALSYAEATQVPGYTALKSRPAGLFGGNAALSRERSESVDLAAVWVRGAWRLDAVLFRREDARLVDWTFSASTASVRQANPVNMDVTGLEFFATWQGQRLDVTTGYAFLEKDADYGTAAVDASYYALNFPRHRATLALNYSPWDAVTLRWDSEWREQRPNLLRTSADRALLVSLSATWTMIPAVELSFIVDNLFNDGFQEFPGTPAAPRQFSASIVYRW